MNQVALTPPAPLTRAEAKRLAIHVAISGALSLFVALAVLALLSDAMSGDASPVTAGALKLLVGGFGASPSLAILPGLALQLYFYGSLWTAASRVMGRWGGGALMVVAWLARKTGLPFLVAVVLLVLLWRAARKADLELASPIA